MLEWSFPRRQSLCTQDYWLSQTRLLSLADENQGHWWNLSWIPWAEDVLDFKSVISGGSLLESMTWERSVSHIPLGKKNKTKQTAEQDAACHPWHSGLLLGYSWTRLVLLWIKVLVLLEYLLTSAQRMLGGELLHLGSSDDAMLWATKDKCCSDSV